MRRNNPLAFLAAIFSVTAVAWTLGYATPPDDRGQRAGLLVGVPRSSTSAARSSWRCCPRSSRSSSPISSTRCRRSSASPARRPHRRGRPADQPAARPDRRRAWRRSAPGWPAPRRERRTSRASPASAWARAPDARRSSPRCASCRASSSRRWPPPFPATRPPRCSCSSASSMFQSMATIDFASHRGRAAGLRHARADSADALDHAGHSLGIPAARAALRRSGTMA